LHIEKEGIMKNLLRTEGADAPPTDTRAAGLAARLATSRPPHMASQRWKAFALLVVAYFITIVDFTIVNVALPTIGRELRFPESGLQWVVTAYGLTFAGFLLLGGRAADLLGRRRLLMAGLAVFTIASLAGGLATSDTFLIVMRGVQGLGAALVLPAALSIVMNMFSEGTERNKALGIWGRVGALGGTVGLLAGGIFTAYAGWRYIFFFNVPIGAAALALAPKVLPESGARSGQRRYDTFGAVSITAALLVFVYAISQAPQVGWAAAQTIAMFAVGTALLALFLVVETKAEAPLLPLPFFRLRSLAGSNAVGFLLGTSFLTFVFLDTLYMQQVLGFSALATAFAFIPISIGALAGVTERDAGVASGLLNTSQNLGGAIGVAVASSIAASHSHTLARHGYATAAALTGGFQWALWVCGLTALAAIPVAFVLIRSTRKADVIATAQAQDLVMATTR
jgi:MFS family permease